MYDYAITTPANTTKAAPQRTDVGADVGVVTQFQVAFPPGAQGFHHVLIARGGSVLWPRNVGEGFAWDNFTIVFNPLYEITAAPEAFEIVTWNLDDTFEHSVAIRFNIVPRAAVFPDRPEAGLLQNIAGLLGGRRRGPE